LILFAKPHYSVPISTDRQVLIPVCPKAAGLDGTYRL
jgi:hypothetical protein